MNYDPTNMAVGALAHFCQPLAARNSIRASAERLETSGLPAIPVLNEGEYIGAFTQTSIALSFSRGLTLDDPVGRCTDNKVQTINTRELGCAALRKFEDTGVNFLVVVDDEGRPHGILTPSNLVAPVEFRNRPTTAGGMATPFGVYITNGTISGGVGPWALAATGALMFVLLAVAGATVNGIEMALPKALGNSVWVDVALKIAALVVFRTGMWVTGVSGLHAAEHQVVNAIEQGEPLEFETVKRMSRVHPRCGTNIAVGLGIFVSILSITAIKDMELRVLLGAITTFFFYRPLGTLAQLYITTSKPSPKQLMKGIASGRDMLTKYQRDPHVSTNPFLRIYNSGLIHVVVGASAVAGLVTLLATVLAMPPAWRNIIGI